MYLRTVFNHEYDINSTNIIVRCNIISNDVIIGSITKVYDITLKTFDDIKTIVQEDYKNGLKELNDSIERDLISVDSYIELYIITHQYMMVYGRDSRINPFNTEIKDKIDSFVRAIVRT